MEAGQPTPSISSGEDDAGSSVSSAFFFEKDDALLIVDDVRLVDLSSRTLLMSLPICRTKTCEGTFGRSFLLIFLFFRRRMGVRLLRLPRRKSSIWCYGEL